MRASQALATNILALFSLLLPAKLSRGSIIRLIARRATAAGGAASLLPSASPTMPAAGPSVTFRPVGSTPKDFSSQELEELWSLIGNTLSFVVLYL
jgi:hypothetical protein